MAQQTAAPLRISLSDIALLARVQRPVVSMWRTRAARTNHPFPDAIVTDRGQPAFDSSDTSRGDRSVRFRHWPSLDAGD